MITQSALIYMTWTHHREVPHGAGGQRRDDAAAGLEGGAEALQAVIGGESFSCAPVYFITCSGSPFKVNMGMTMKSPPVATCMRPCWLGRVNALTSDGRVTYGSRFGLIVAAETE